jgi:hypothetical protein
METETTTMLRIEMDRGRGWELRGEGAFTGTVEEITRKLPAYAIQYPHRALLDGVVVATAEPKRRRAAR